MKLLLTAIVLLIFFSLLQVTISPLPFGAVVILLWLWLRRVKHLVLLSVVYSLFLASFSSLPSYLVLLSMTTSLLLFTIGKRYLPAKATLTLGLIVVCAATFELSLTLLSRMTNL